MTNPDSADKRGYLTEPFRLFHLRDRSTGRIPYHYHEFHKLILFLSGELTYRVEGRGYEPKGGDLLLIPAHAIHQPLIGADKPYERSILWIQPEALRELGLDVCFQRCHEENAYLLTRDRYDRPWLQSQLQSLEQALNDEQFGSDVLAQSLFSQLMVSVNRWVLERAPEQREQAVRSDPKIDEILAYINQNLTADLSSYRRWNEIRLGLLVVPVLTNLSFYYLTLNTTGLFCAAMSLIASLFCVPTRKRIWNELDLLKEEKEEE